MGNKARLNPVVISQWNSFFTPFVQTAWTFNLWPSVLPVSKQHVGMAVGIMASFPVSALCSSGQINSSRNQSVKAYNGKSWIWVLLGQSLSRSCHIQRGFTDWWLPRCLLWAVTHCNSYLQPGSSAQAVSISSFCSAFRKESVWLLKVDSPVSSLGVVLRNGLWTAQLCLCSIGLLWLREGGQKPGVPIKHGLKASSW